MSTEKQPGTGDHKAPTAPSVMPPPPHGFGLQIVPVNGTAERLGGGQRWAVMIGSGQTFIGSTSMPLGTDPGINFNGTIVSQDLPKMYANTERFNLHINGLTITINFTTANPPGTTLGTLTGKLFSVLTGAVQKCGGSGAWGHHK